VLLIDENVAEPRTDNELKVAVVAARLVKTPVFGVVDPIGYGEANKETKPFPETA
jgi:hypothetical protein